MCGCLHMCVTLHFINSSCLYLPVVGYNTHVYVSPCHYGAKLQQGYTNVIASKIVTHCIKVKVNDGILHIDLTVILL